MTAAVGQSRVASLVEALVNVAIGFGINFAANFAILPAAGFPVPTVGQNLAMGLMFTAVSVARSYCVRRWFNARVAAFARRTAGRVR